VPKVPKVIRFRLAFPTFAEQLIQPLISLIFANFPKNTNCIDYTNRLQDNPAILVQYLPALIFPPRYAALIGEGKIRG